MTPKTTNPEILLPAEGTAPEVMVTVFRDVAKRIIDQAFLRGESGEFSPLQPV